VSGRLLQPWGMTEPITLSPDPQRTADVVHTEPPVRTPITVRSTPENALPLRAPAPPTPTAPDLTSESRAARLHPELRPARPLQRASEFSKQIAPRALALGRELAPRAADLGRRFGRQLGPMARRGAVATGHGLRATGRRLADLRPLLRVAARLLGRGFAAIGGLTLFLLGGLARGSTITGDRIAGALQRHRAVLLALFARALWWTALALLFLGGRALVEIHERAPFVEAALPVLLTGLVLCAFLLLFARHARMRWAAFALGLGHGGLLALVWVVSAIA
jgi:hypothetical protein